MPVLKNIGCLASCRSEGSQSSIHEIPNAALAWEGSRITWVGAESELPGDCDSSTVIDAAGDLVIPGMVDCHTHLAFGGWRAQEFEQRILGRSYLEITRAGGGISRTVRETRAASEDELTKRAEEFLLQMARLGVTTVECKSGYGLDCANELKLLRVYKRLGETQPVRIVSTFLGAHLVPAEFSHDRAGYLRLLCDDLIPTVARRQLASFCDVFVEESAFTISEALEILETAKNYGLRPKLHADQLSNGGGAVLAASVGAVSADHLEHISDEGIEAMKAAGVIAVALPIASLYLRQDLLPARKLVDAGLAIAISTDFNPGSAPSYHLPLAMLLCCVKGGMTPAETLKGVTIRAAKAVGLEDRVGSLEAGKEADFAVINAPDVNHWIYHFRPNACVRTFIAGKEVVTASQ